MERAMGDTYKIKVIKADTGEVVKTLETATERSAERVERGLSINLNHSDYYTVIEPPKDTKLPQPPPPPPAARLTCLKRCADPRLQTARPNCSTSPTTL